MCENSELTERLALYSAALVNRIHLHLNEALLAEQNEKYLLERRREQRAAGTDTSDL